MPELLSYRLQKSRESIRNMLSLSKNPYLALSFGKDSLVMLDLVREQYPDIPCLFLKSEETYLMFNYEQIISEYLEQGVNLYIIDTKYLAEANGDFHHSRKLSKKRYYTEEFFNGWDGMFMGLRIQESKPRRITLIKKENNLIGHRIMQYKSGKRSGMYRCCPVADWKAEEIMFYLEERELPILDVYRFGAETRTTARIPREAQRESAIALIKANNPENYNKLIQLIPELKLL